VTTEQSIRLHSAQPAPYTWEGVDVLGYKEEDGTFKAVTRQVLTDAEHGQGASLRYFEVGPGGHTTLEHHEHTHVVVPIRGRGRALIGTEVVELAQHDVVFVPSWTWHQFQAVGDEPFGFLCAVTVERDRPVRPTAEQIAELESHPGVRGFIKY
jgi:quercetin dioxygenase-like cupin family protein